MKIIAITADTDKMKITVATIITTVNTEPDDLGTTANTIMAGIDAGLSVTCTAFFFQERGI